MPKVKISNQAFPYPMPMVVVSAVVEGKVNHMAVAWVTRVNHSPPMLAVALNKVHYTNRGIHQHRAFGVSIPSVEQAELVDYVGLVSGADRDKSGVFELFQGTLADAPMIASCPLTMACRLLQVLSFPTNELFVGEIVEAYCDESCLVHDRPDVERMRPYGLTMPDNRYWTVGAYTGKAWSVGMRLRKGD
jgi:flavin reductase (DIM6/NTAB) family NADH-FMN oxidoreductase RutF